MTHSDRHRIVKEVKPLINNEGPIFITLTPKQKEIRGDGYLHQVCEKYGFTLLDFYTADSNNTLDDLLSRTLY